MSIASFAASIRRRRADREKSAFNARRELTREAGFREHAGPVRNVKVIQRATGVQFPAGQPVSALTIAPPKRHWREWPGGLAWRLPCGVTALCVGFLLTAGASLAANDGSSDRYSSSSGPADQDLGLLLRKVELQVSAGHAMSPANDNAMDTWQQVLQLRRLNPESPDVFLALTDFTRYMRARAADERTAGRLVVSSDLTVFADQANRLLATSTPMPGSFPEPTRTATRPPGIEPQTSRVAVPSPTGVGRPGAPPVDVLSAPVRSAALAPVPDSHGPAGSPPPNKVPAGGQAGSGASPVAGGTATPPLSRQTPVSDPAPVRPGTVGATPPRETRIALADKIPVPGAVPASVPAVGPATPPIPSATLPADPGKVVTQPIGPAIALVEPTSAPRPPTTAPAAPGAVSLTPEAIAMLLQRGDVMLQQNDVIAARLFYERAAAAGSARGATNAGKTYDPAFLSTIDARGLQSDVPRAMYWYRIAATVLGDKEAAERLKVLVAQTGR